MAEGLVFHRRAQPEATCPAFELPLLEDPDAQIDDFGSGVGVWCEAAIIQLTIGLLDPNATGVWQFAADASQSSRGLRQLAPEVVIERARDFLERDQSLAQSGHTPVLALVRNSEDGPTFTTGPAHQFMSTWSDLLWQQLGAVLRRRGDRGAHVEGAGLQGAILKEEYVHRPEPMTIRRRSPIDQWAAVPTDQVDDRVDAARLGAPVLDETLRAITRIVGSAASTVYLQQLHPSLDARVLGVMQTTLERTDKPATRRLQRVRIFVSWRRVYVAACEGQIGLRGDGPMDTGMPMWTRARKLSQAFAALARDALFDFEQPSEPVPTGPARTALEQRVYQEARRATAHLLFMLEQVLGAEGRDRLASQFAEMLDEYRAAPHEHPFDGEVEGVAR